MKNSQPKGRNKELVKNTLILAAGKLISPLFSFFLLPIYTRLVMPDEYGIVDLINTYVGLLAPIILLRLDVGVFRYMVDARGKHQEVCCVLTNTLQAAAAPTLLAFLILAIGGVLGWLPFASAIALNLFAQILISIFGQVARGLGKNKLFAISSIIGTLINVGLGLLFVVVFRMGGLGILLATGISGLINGLILTLAIKPHRYIAKCHRDSLMVRELLRFCMPLIFENMSWWAMSSGQRTIISIMLGAAANGIFSVSNRLGSLINQFTNVFWMSWSESAALYVDSPDRNKFYSDTLNSYIRLFGQGNRIRKLLDTNYFKSVFYIPSTAKAFGTHASLKGIVLTH